MSGDHGDGGQGHHSHGGSGGLGWNLLDTVVAAATTVLAGLLAEMLWRSWRLRQQGVRFALTPAGEAATRKPPAAGEGRPPLVDLDALREAVERGDL